MYSFLDWRKKIAKEIEHIAATYKDEDDILLPLIDASTVVALKANPEGIPPGWVARFVLPSHLLRVARDAYDDGDHALAASFCEKALKQAAAIPVDAQVEALRLLSLSYARLARESEFKSTVKRLGTYHGQSAKRNYHFVWGFWYRRIGQYDQAEKEFRAAYRVDPRNFHVLRELATILTHQTRYEEAESYARAALKIAPTNPFIIDCVCEVIIGKMRTSTMLQKDIELSGLMRDLKKYGDFEGYSFYENRMASYYRSINDYEEAIRFANAAVDRTPKKYSVVLNRALILVDSGDKVSARRDLDMLKRLVDDDRTGEGKSGKFLVKVLEVKLAASDGNYHNAMMKLQGDFEMPQAVHQRLCKDVAWMIENDYSVKDKELKAWAKK